MTTEGRYAHISDEDLKKELARREDARKRERHEAGIAKFKLLREIMKKAPLETLELFAPSHAGRGSYCSDDSPHRDYAHDGYLECLRCYLLSQSTHPDPIEITFHIRLFDD